MRVNKGVVSLAVLAAAICAVPVSPSRAAPAVVAEQAARPERGTEAFAQTRRRPRIVIHPLHRRLSPNAKRICRFWLAQEFRPSGTVITPQQRCWWEQ